MTTGERPVRTVVVVGAGIVGLSAALAFARTLSSSEVTLLEAPHDPSALTDALPATLPTVHRYHAVVGLDEMELVGAGIALHRLGTRFDCWSATGESWFHTFGEHGLKAGAVPFHQLWLQEHDAGGGKPFGAYGAAVAMAAAGRFVHPAEDASSPLSTFLYGLNLDPECYRQRLETAAARLDRQTGNIADVERRRDGKVAALVLEDGRRLSADLYLDCTGPQASVLGKIDDRFEDWSEWLPCDRSTLYDTPMTLAEPFDTVTRLDQGWEWTVPLPARTFHAQFWSSQHGVERENAITLRAGRRTEPWVHNVLAIGDGAVTLDPLHGAGLHLAQSAILRALDLLPSRDMHQVELHEYNRRTRLEHERVRDFVALHYLRSGRTETGFWRDLAARFPPDGLARTLEQFTRRGRLPFFEEDSFSTDSWLAVLLGLGVIPEAVDPVALGIDPERAREGMIALAQRIAALPPRFPPYSEMLARLRAQRASSAGGRRISAVRSSAGTIGGKPFPGRSR